MVSQRRLRLQRGPKPRYVWVPGNDQAQTTAAASSEMSADLLANYFSDSGRDTGPGMVIERIIGMLIIRSTNVNEGSPFMCGLQVVGEGITALAITPKVEIGRFLWYLASECSLEANEVAAGTFISRRTFYPFEVHSRARLNNIGDEMRLAMQNDAADQVIQWAIYTRTLLRVT